MGDPAQHHLSTDAAAWLAETFRRNSERFAGWRMEADPPADPAPTDPPADPPTDPGKTPPWGDAANFNAEKAWELIQNLRAEKGDPNKVTDLERQIADLQTASQAQLDAIAKAAGLKPDDTPPDPAKLAEQVAAAQGETTAEKTGRLAAERQLAIYKVAADPEVGANAARLLDSSKFLESIKDIDPTDAAALTEKVKAAIEADEMFKASGTPTTPPFPGGPRTSATPSAGSLGEAIANKMARPTS